MICVLCDITTIIIRVCFFDTFHANTPVEQEEFGNGFIAMQFHQFGTVSCGTKMHHLPV